MLYDALQYAKQVQNAEKFHKESKDYKGAGSDEFMPGFKKEDRLLPVVTLVVYFNSKPWDGPLSVHEMFEKGQDAEILSLPPDYKINLLAPETISDGDFEKFRMTLGKVLAFIKHSGDKNKLEELMKSDEGFRRLGRKEVELLNTCVNAGLSVNETGEEETDVCKAIEDMKKEAVEKALAKAEEEKRAACKAIEEEAQKEKEKAEAEKTAMVKRLYRTGKLTLEEIAECSGLLRKEVEMVCAVVNA